jgi:hypothetical protein
VYLTPKWISDALGPFDTDCCAADDREFDIGTRFNFTKSDDGLPKFWEGFVWCNPPYGVAHGEAQFLSKMALHNNGIALINVKTSTKYWRDYVFAYASGILFLDKRVQFLSGATGSIASSPVRDSCLVAYGPRARERLNVLGHKGTIMGVVK